MQRLPAIAQQCSHELEIPDEEALRTAETSAWTVGELSSPVQLSTRSRIFVLGSRLYVIGPSQMRHQLCAWAPTGLHSGVEVSSCSYRTGPGDWDSFPLETPANKDR